MDKLTKRELKTPDRIWMASRDLVSWATEQWVGLVTVVGFVFVVVIGISVYFHLRDKTEGEAQFHFSKAKSYFEQAQIGGSTEKSDVKADLKKELDILDKDFSSSKANAIASLLRAEILMSEKKWPEAILELEKYRRVLPRDKAELAVYPLAIAYEQAGKYDEALKAFNDIASSEKSPLRADAILGRARVERSLKRFDDARKSYGLFIEKFPQNAEVGTVRGLMAELPTVNVTSK